MDKEDEKRIANLEAQVRNAVATKDDFQNMKFWLSSGIAAFAGGVILILLSSIIQVFLHFSDKI